MYLGVSQWKTEDKEEDVNNSFTAQKTKEKRQSDSPAGGLLELPGKKWMGWILAQPKPEIFYLTEIRRITLLQGHWIPPVHKCLS